MTIPTPYLSALPSATIPADLMVPPAEAWAVILAVLVLSCAVLWFLTRQPRNGNPERRRHNAARPLHAVTGRGDINQAGRPRRLAHHLAQRTSRVA